MILAELQTFVVGRHGMGSWERIAERAGLAGRVYLPISTYPDEEAAGLLEAATEVSGKSRRALLTEFGGFLAPTLLEMYSDLLHPEWTTLDILEHADRTIHRVVRLREPGAEPPALHCTRTADAVTLLYDSPRALCPLALGLVLGIARVRGEQIRSDEPECMERGAAACRVVFRATGTPR